MARDLLTQVCMILVRNRMTSPVITIDPETPIDEIGRLLEARAISAVPVVDDDRIVGIVSTTDVVGAISRAIVTSERTRTTSPTTTAADVMSSPVLSVGPDEPLDNAAWRLVAGRVHRLVVVDRETQHAIGILSARDMLEELVHRRVDAPIGSIMSTPVESIEISDTIDDAIKRLRAANIHGLIVIDGMAPVGVFTHAEAIAARKLPPTLRTRPVEDVMSYETICLNVATPIYRAAAYCISMNVRRILVVDSRHLVGILSCVDLVGVLSRAPQEGPQLPIR